MSDYLFRTGEAILVDPSEIAMLPLINQYLGKMGVCSSRAAEITRAIGKSEAVMTNISALLLELGVGMRHRKWINQERHERAQRSARLRAQHRAHIWVPKGFDVYKLENRANVFVIEDVETGWARTFRSSRGNLQDAIDRAHRRLVSVMQNGNGELTHVE